jgi:hypothetical protein
MSAAAPVVRPQSFIWPSVRPHLSGLVYDEESRDHKFNGTRIQSVTQILTVAGRSANFDKVRPNVLAFAGRRGTAVHLAAQLYMEGDLDESSIAPEIAGYFAAVKLLCEQRHLALIKSEAVIFSRQYGYTGRADFVGLVDRRQLAVLDFATGDPAAARKDLQITAYDLALTEEFPQFADKVLRWSVQLFRTGKYKLTPHTEFSRHKAEFLSALTDARVLMGVTWSRPPMTNSATMPEPSAEPMDEPIPEPEAMPEPEEIAVFPEPMPEPMEEPAAAPMEAVGAIAARAIGMTDLERRFLEAKRDGLIPPDTGWAEWKMTAIAPQTSRLSGPAFEEPGDVPLQMAEPSPEREQFAAAHDAVKAALAEPMAEPEPDEPVALALMDVPRVALDIIRRVVAQIPMPPDVITDPTAYAADRDLIVALGARLACEVHDQDTAQLATDYAVVCDAWARRFHEFFDPRVADSHKVWKRDCVDRSAFCEPFEMAKDCLTGRDGAVNTWIRQEKERKEREAREEQRRRDDEARKQRQAEEAERQRAEAERQRAAKAAEDARLEQERAARAAQDARRQGDAEAAAEAERQRADAERLEREERERQQAAARAAQEAEQRRDTTVSETVQTDRSTTTLRGATGRANWTYELRVEGGTPADALKELVIGIATKDVLTRFVEKVRAIPGWESSPATEILNLAFFEAEQAPDIPVAAVEENAPYLRTRAKADKDTLKWPGVRFYDAGSTAVRGKR